MKRMDGCFRPSGLPGPGGLSTAPVDGPAVLTVQQAATLLQVSRNHLYTLISQDRVPHIRFGKLIRIPRWGLLDFVARESGAALPDAHSVAIPRIQSVHVEQPAATKEGQHGER